MIQVLHISAECYPAAKTGGLGDVVGALPKYQTQAGILSAAIIPKYGLKWINQQEWEVVHSGSIRVDWWHHGFTIQKEKHDKLGFPLFVVDIPGLYDRPGIYGDPQTGAPYGDETERYLVFQQAVLHWLRAFPEPHRPRVLHCHDHHTGLIPFMVKHCPEYRTLQNIPTIFTIHNGQYQGWISWRNQHLLPYYDANAGGLMEWKNMINPMAAAVKNAWAVTTVSPSYLGELHHNSLGLEPLFRQEWFKEHGILNGIDAAIWDPQTDPMIQHHLQDGAVAAFKAANKRLLCEWFGFSEEVPLISFIGRMVSEKGVDLLPDTFRKFMHAGGRASFLVLGTGEPWTQNQFRAMAHQYAGRFNAVIDYNEALAHQIYAGSDFLIMPSRVEPCGLNQMYAMRYGAIPIVRAIGGLKDTVPDIGEPDGSGRGIRFEQFSVEDAFHAVYRAVSMWHNDPGAIAWLREKIMAIDFSWESAVQIYFHVYRQVGARLETGLALVTPAQEAPVSEVADTKTTAAIKSAATSAPKPVKKKAAAASKSKEAVPKEKKASNSVAKPKQASKKTPK